MILDGKYIRDSILDELKEEINNLNTDIKLVVVQIGNDDASNVYVKQKMKMCEYVGYKFEHLKLSEDVDTDSVVNLITRLNNDNDVNGIMVQLPIPDNIDKEIIINAISPLKDVDGLTNLNNGRLMSGDRGLFPCTASGIMELLDRYNISIKGKNVVIINRSDLIGKPIFMMMLNNGATVSVCHSQTKNLSSYTKMADILISAVGIPNFITSDMISENVIIIDVGISKINNKISGDVDYESVKDMVKYITPVPGGVGPMTVATLGKNLLIAFKMQNK